jgi:hypothetical protein
MYSSPPPQGFVKNKKGMYVPDAYTKGEVLFSGPGTVIQNSSKNPAGYSWADKRGSFESPNFPTDWALTPLGERVLSGPTSYNVSHSQNGGASSTIHGPSGGPSVCQTTAGCGGGCSLDSSPATIPPGFPMDTYVRGPRSIAKSMYGEAQVNDTVKDGYVRHPFMYKTTPRDSLYGPINLTEVDALGNLIRLGGMRYPYTNRDVRELKVQSMTIQPYPSIVRWSRYSPDKSFI